MKRPTPLLILLLLWCGPAAAAPELERVTLQLKWHHQFQFAGYYAAREQGFYREAGLEVEIRPARPGDDAVDRVVRGEAQFGVGNSSLILNRQRGAPVVVLAVVFQHSPLVLAARSGEGIRELKELKGRRLMIEPDAAELVAYLRHEGLRGEYQAVGHSFTAQELIAGRVDAMSAYVTDELYELHAAGVPYSLFRPFAAGLDFYGDNLFTTEQEVAAHPERVRAFRQASLRGWAYALAHPEEMAALIHERYAPEHTVEHLLFEAEQMRNLINAELVEIGYMHRGRWRRIADHFAAAGMLPPGYPLKEFLFDPAPPIDLTWVKAGGAAVLGLLLAVGGVMLHIARLNRRLRASEQRFRLLAENAYDVIWTMDLNGRMTYVSPSVQRLRGYSVAEATGERMEDVVAEGSLPVARDGFAHLLAHGDVPEHQWELELRRRDGSTVWTEIIVNPLRDDAGRVTGLIGITRDIDEQRRTREALRTRVVAIEAAAEAVVITTPEGVIEHVNPAFTRMTGYEASEVTGRTPAVLKSGVQGPEFYRQLWRTISAGEVWRGEIVNRRKDGRLYTELMAIAPVTGEDGRIHRFVAIKHDVSERKDLEARLERLAHFDPLTGLPNRALFFDRLDRALAEARRYGDSVGLLFLDLDGFKQVNDNLGHSEGDRLLTEAAERLRCCVRESDTVARVGGDEFCVILSRLTASRDAAVVAGKLLAALLPPFLLGGEAWRIGASIGISLCPEDACDGAELMRHADDAMYEVKRRGKNGFAFYADIPVGG